MTERCKIGDMAIIIRDEVGCEANLGRVVYVLGPKRTDPSGGTAWLIEPVNGATISYLTVHRKVKVGTPFEIEHWDHWLLPIRPESELEELSEPQGEDRPMGIEVDSTEFTERVDAALVAMLSYLPPEEDQFDGSGPTTASIELAVQFIQEFHHGKAAR